MGLLGEEEEEECSNLSDYQEEEVTSSISDRSCENQLAL